MPVVQESLSGEFLKIGVAKWEKSGSNGENVVLNAKNQKMEGEIFVDNISTLDLSLANGSSYLGTINAENSAKSLKITLDGSSTLTLTGDSYITSLENSVSDNSNINLNGYTLYVGEKAITSTNYSSEKISSNKNDKSELENNKLENNSNEIKEEFSKNENIDYKIYVIISIAIILIIVFPVIAIVKTKKVINKC